VKSSDGFSFAACAELVISHCCFEIPFEESVDRLKKMMDTKVISSNYDAGPKGFATK
jgi:hypothetical protein